MFGRKLEGPVSTITGSKVETATRSSMPLNARVLYSGGHVTTRHLGLMRSERIEGDAGLGAMEYARMERLRHQASQHRSVRAPRPLGLRR
jgi:hypothetical protein